MQNLRGDFLSSKWIGINNKYKWQCKNGHVWDAFYTNIKNGHWCPYCSGNARKNKDDYYNLAASNGGKCVFIGKNTTDTKTTWECSIGHTWKNSYGNICSGQWCPVCAGNFKRSKEDFYTLAKNKNGECLLVGSNSKDNLSKWKCQKGHIWNASYGSIKGGHWCPYCAGNLPKNIDDYKVLADNNDGECLFCSKSVLDPRSKWKCHDGHIWCASFTNIRSGTWCPHCSLGKNQNIICKIIKDLFPNKNIEINFNGFDWLKTKYGLQHIDIYVVDLKLAIEYDGEQHFKPVCFGGISLKRAKQNLKLTKARDKLKNLKINQHPEDVKYFIRINYKEMPTNKENLIIKLSNAGLNIGG